MTPQQVLDFTDPAYTSIAQDEDGTWYAYKGTPNKESHQWGCMGGYSKIGGCLPIKSEGEWYDSLLTRKDPVELVLHMMSTYTETYLPQSMMDAVAKAETYHKENH